jgi:hypothetical protein
MVITSLTKFGVGFGMSPAVEACDVSVGSSDESVEKWFLVEVGCNQWFSSLECLASCVESSWSGRLFLLGIFVQGMVIFR